MEPPAIIALAVSTLAVMAIVRGWDVRLVLAGAAMVIGLAAGNAAAVLAKFLDTFSDEKFVLPICSAMGFATYLRHCGCDRHLVRLLLTPVQRYPALVVPGVLVTAFLVNVTVISQASTAVCVGPVAIPLLRAAGASPVITAATLVLGCSVGGELLNPGAPELQSVAEKTGMAPMAQARGTIPPVLAVYSVTAFAIFWLSNRRRENAAETAPESPSEPISFFKAMIPLVPLVFLFLTGPPWYVVQVPKHWLVTVNPEWDAARQAAAYAKYDARLIGMAMLIGVIATALATPREAKSAFVHFFDGAGQGFTKIVSIIVTANCFGKALEVSKLADVLGAFITAHPQSLLPLAAAGPCLFAWISGSGMASTQSLFGFFVPPALAVGADPNAVGALVSVAAAAGRTMSPVAAVVLLCGTLTGTPPFAIIRRLVVPLLVGLAVTVAVKMLNLFG